MSKVAKPREYEGLPDLDEYKTALLSNNTARFIREQMRDRGSCALSMSMMDGATMYKMMFVDLHHALHPEASWQNSSGARWFIGIERIGCFTFANLDTLYPSYLEEKFRHNFGTEVGDNLHEFFKLMSKYKY